MRNNYLWLLHMVTGAIVVVLLGIHLVTLHPGGFLFIASKVDTVMGIFGLQTASAIRPGGGMSASVYIALLAFVLYHGIYGLRGIILEIAPSDGAGRIVTLSLIIIGIILFIGGFMSRLFFPQG
ncbi:MAG: hypothetical protein HYX81_03845 [Chloroflexi bacterium]|nr:hypothetical protein [Chloroflexota bacterium]